MAAHPKLPVLFVFTALVFAAPSALAQDGAILTSDEPASATVSQDSVRQYYIKGFSDYFFLYPVLKQRTLNFQLEKPDDESLLTFKPNNTFSLGMGMYVFEIGIEIAFAIPLREQSIERYGDSDARDLQLNILAKRWGVDAFSQRYSGFYIDDNQREVPPDEPYPQRPDITTRNLGLTGYYIFNHKKVSVRSAYNYSERQLHSKGSFILLGALYTFRVSADSSIVKADRQQEFGHEVDFTRLRYTTFSVAPGYTFNLTYNNFFLNATLAVGPAHHWLNYDLEGQSSPKHDIAINSFFGTRFAIGYNGYRLFGGVSFVSQGSQLRFGDATFSNNNGVFKILVGYRFAEVGVLKKRVWDWVPFGLGTGLD